MEPERPITSFLLCGVQGSPSALKGPGKSQRHKGMRAFNVHKREFTLQMRRDSEILE